MGGKPLLRQRLDTTSALLPSNAPRPHLLHYNAGMMITVLQPISLHSPFRAMDCLEPTSKLPAVRFGTLLLQPRYDPHTATIAATDLPQHDLLPFAGSHTRTSSIVLSGFFFRYWLCFGFQLFLYYDFYGNFYDFINNHNCVLIHNLSPSFFAISSEFISIL